MHLHLSTPSHMQNTNATVVRMNKRKVDFLKQKAHIIKKSQLNQIL